jgi:hypothetical protein
MASYNFTIPRGDRSIPDILARIPRGFKDEASKGFAVLAEIGQQHYAEILQAVIVTLESKRPPLEKLAETLKIPVSQISSLFAACMFTVSVLGEGGSADEFINACLSASLLREDRVPKVRSFLETIVAQQPQIGRTIRRAEMPGQVLPSVSNFEVVVDLRMAFDGEAVAEVVPVAIVHVDTDAEVEELWFQASRQQMQQLKIDVDEAIRRMDLAEAWGNRGPKA